MSDGRWVKSLLIRGNGERTTRCGKGIQKTERQETKGKMCRRVVVFWCWPNAQSPELRSRAKAKNAESVCGLQFSTCTAASKSHQMRVANDKEVVSLQVEEDDDASKQTRQDEKGNEKRNAVRNMNEDFRRNKCEIRETKQKKREARRRKQTAKARANANHKERRARHGRAGVDETARRGTNAASGDKGSRWRGTKTRPKVGCRWQEFKMQLIWEILCSISCFWKEEPKEEGGMDENECSGIGKERG